jgi:hypothetical protein
VPTVKETYNTPLEIILTEIVLVPVGEEVNDLEAISVVEDVASEVFRGVQALMDYRSHIESDTTRGAGIILLLGDVAHQIIAQKDLLMAFLQAGTAAIGVISKQRRVSKIIVTLDGDSLSVENPATVTTEKLLAAFLAKHPATATTITPSSKLQVIATVSKKARAAGR